MVRCLYELNDKYEHFFLAQIILMNLLIKYL